MESDKIKAYYNREVEKNRLDLEYFKLEGIRTREIIERYVTKPSTIVDIGGGAGFYAFWLQSLGHKVSMIDLSPKNIELARNHAALHGVRLTSCTVGDATNLPYEDNEFDVAILLGPLYHLTEKNDRIKALAEAKRVLKPGGILISAFISRYASLFDGLRRDLIKDDRFEKILLNDLDNGIHLNDTDNLEYFTTAFFHTPMEMKEEIATSGLRFKKLVAVESAGWLIENLSVKMKDEVYRNKLHKILDRIESNEDLIAMSPHVLGIAEK